MSGRKLTAAMYADPLITNADMSASIIGTPINIINMDNLAVQLVWTGANPLGSIKFQISQNYQQGTGVGTWTNLQSSPGVDFSVLPDGSSGDSAIDFNQIGFPWFRVVYVTASGSIGSLSYTYGAKMI